MRFLLISSLLGTSLLCAAPAVAQSTADACSTITLGTNGAFNGFMPSPGDAWHQDISQAALDPNSAKIINTVGDLGGSHLHPDFSSTAGGYGIPYSVVDSSQTPNVPVQVNTYTSESDVAAVPLTADSPVEGGQAGCSAGEQDHHALVVDRKSCVVYELYQAGLCNGTWTSNGEAVWDLLGVEKRPYGYSSVDAAGLSIFAGLLRYDEIAAGQINHAIRFTAAKTKSGPGTGYFTAPATHAAGNNSTTDNIMGMRIRLRADYDISSYSATNQIILRAMKKYGMILADNGSNLYIQGATDARWNDDDLHNLNSVPNTAFEVVQMGTVYSNVTAPTGPAPVINSFTASQSTVASGAAVTLTPNVTNASYSYIDKLGFVRDTLTVKPTETTTYLLTSRNAFGEATSSVTVTVSSATTPTLTFTPVANRVYSSAAFTVSASSASSGTVTYAVLSGPATISGNTVTLTGVGNVTLQASQAAAGTYAAATATTSFTVSPADPSLAFVAIGNKTYPSASFTVSATTNSGGSISYSVASGPATISGNTVTLTGGGTVSLSATQAAAGNYAMGTANTSFTVTASAGTKTPVIRFTSASRAAYGSTFTVSATSNSTGAITYSIASGPAYLSGNVVTPTGVGTVVILATQASTSTYAAGSKTQSVTITKAKPTLTFAAVPAKKKADAPFAVSATSASTGTVTYTVASGRARMSGNVVTLTGTGAVTLRARQVSDGNYAAATTTTSFTVTK